MAILSILEKQIQAKQLYSQDGQTPVVKPIILVAEDHDDSRSMLKQLLETWGYSVVEATNGEEAVRLAELEHPDLILMDVRLPLLDGFAAARQIRQFSPPDQVPIVFLSAHAERSYLSQAQKIGAADYLIKPMGLTQLENTLLKHLKKPIRQNVLRLMKF